MISFGERIKTARLAKKLSQRALAAKVDLNFTYLSKIENGDNPPPSDEKIYLLAEHLDLDPDELFAAARRLPTDLAKHGFSAKVPKVMRLSKELNDSELDELLSFLEKRHKKTEQPE